MPADIEPIHSAVGSETPYAANHILEVVRNMFNWGKVAGLAPREHLNPTLGIKWFPKRQRRRYITTVEMPEFIRALEAEDNEYARHGLWLLLLTGLRSIELLKAKWADIDWDAGTLFVGLTKNSEFTERLAAFTWPHAPYVDLYSFLPDAVDQNGGNATTEGFRLIASRGIHAIPTYGLQRNDALWDDLGAVAAQLNNGFCFRIDIEDLDDQSEDSWVAIIERSAEMNLPAKSIDIVLDLRSIGDIRSTTLDDLVRNFLDYKPHTFTPRFIAIAGSSALKDVGRVPKDGTLAVRRQELLLWTRLQEDWASATKLGFSDYGVLHPDFSQNIPAINANAKIRYTRGQSIHYFRGVGLYKPSNFGQYHDVAARVVQSPHYRGRQYSAGDKKIWDCANRNCGAGNLGTWVRVDQNHHIETTVEQLGFLTQRLASGIDASAVDVLFQGV